MDSVQTFYMIQCIGNRRKCVYSKGIYVTHIPFETFETVRLEKITLVNQKQFTHDCFPIFKQFQQAWRRRHKWIRNPRRILARELYGISIRPPPLRLHHQ
jgi:hypothetical protein